jgi:hypothetical protein
MPNPGFTIPWSTASMAALAAVTLAACGGGDEFAADEPRATVATAATVVAAPLIADDGSTMPSDPALLPADPGARTRSGRYASEAQAAQLEGALGSGVIRTDVDTVSDTMPAVDLAVLMAYGQQASAALDAEAPVLVRGRDARLAAAAADRLEAQGFGRVFVVRP